MKYFKIIREKKSLLFINHKTISLWISTFLVFFSFCIPKISFSQDATKIKVSVSGALSCINKKVTLNCSTDVQGAIYKWKGPNGFYSTSRFPETSIPGEYTVNIKEPLTGKVLTADVTILLDTVVPKEVFANTSGALTCKDTLVKLTGNTKTSGVVYNWFGPDGFNSSEKITETSTPGNYIFKVTNPVNGCFSKKNISVYQDIKPPKNVGASVSGILNCVNTKTKLIGFSDTPGVSYHWEGPEGFSSSLSNPLVSSSGIFELTVLKPDNGCEAKANIEVKQDIAKPKDVKVIVSDSLTCNTKIVELTGLSDTKEVNYSWVGPNNFSSDNQNVKINTPGKYTLTVNNLENGCITTKSAEVIKNENTPDDLVLKVSGSLTCKDSIVSIIPSSAFSRLKYIWSGPKNFTSKVDSLNVSVSGEYIVKVTNSVNGCSITKSIVVKENISVPTGVKATVSDVIDCNRTPVKLIGNCDNNKVNFKWKGPNDFESSKQITETAFEGDYEFSVINPENGCISNAKVKVINNCIE